MFKVLTYITVLTLAITMVGVADAQDPMMELDEEAFPMEDEDVDVEDDMMDEPEDDMMDEPEDDMMDDPIEVDEEPEIIVDEEPEEEEFEEEGMDAGGIVIVVVALVAIAGVVFYALRSGK